MEWEEFFQSEWISQNGFTLRGGKWLIRGSLEMFICQYLETKTLIIASTGKGKIFYTPTEAISWIKKTYGYKVLEDRIC